jgi:hypothetical protein
VVTTPPPGSPDRFTERFGDAGLRHFTEATAGNLFDAPSAVRQIIGKAVPLQVGPYFHTATADPVQLGDHADLVGESVPEPDQQLWARLGSDSGYEIAVGPDGAVQAVLLGFNEPLRYVNSSPAAFAEGLLELDMALGAITGTDEPAEASAAFRRLEERLHATDPQAFAEREMWWPLVLDDIRDTASAEWYAAMEVVDADGEKKIFTQSGGICLHPEERLWSSLHAAGVQPEQVVRIHTDLEACFMPGHYCSMWMAGLFPDATLTHTFPYGESADSRAEGLRQLRESADA